MSKKALQGQVIKKTIKITDSNNIYDLTATPLVLAKGVSGVLVIVRDITKEVTLKSELEDQEQMFRSVLLGMPIAT